MRKLLIILGIPLDDLDMVDTLNKIEQFIYKGRVTGQGHQIVTVNTDFVVKALKDPELRMLLQEADLSTADGMPLVWSARLLGVPLRGRVAGSDLVPLLAERAAEKGFSLYLLGAAPGVAARAAEILQARYPGLTIAGLKSPPISSIFDMDPAMAEEIRAVKPDILLVAFGNPKQEKWIRMYAPKLQVPVMMGIGASLDFIAGNARRAPEWMQNSGLEWVHRLLQEPRRLWKRYLVDMVLFSLFFSRQWWIMRKGNKNSMVVPIHGVNLIGDTAIMNVQGRLTISEYDEFVEAGQKALETARLLVVNLSAADFLDSSGVGCLVGLAKKARQTGGDLVLAGVPGPIMEVFSLLHLHNFFKFYPDVPTVLLEEGKKDSSGSPGSERSKEEQVIIEGNGWTVYKGPDQFDVLSADKVAGECLALICENPYLILDLTNTLFIDSAGLAALVKINRIAKEQNGQFRVSSCSKDVITVMKMTRFDRVISIYKDLSSATTS